MPRDFIGTVFTRSLPPVCAKKTHFDVSREQFVSKLSRCIRETIPLCMYLLYVCPSAKIMSRKKIHSY
jgi:hypothetical protein